MCVCVCARVFITIRTTNTPEVRPDSEHGGPGLHTSIRKKKHRAPVRWRANIHVLSNPVLVWWPSHPTGPKGSSRGRAVILVYSIALS